MERLDAGALISRLRGGAGTKGVAAIAAGAALGQGIVALASPFLTRIYTVREIGVFAVYAAILGTLIPASSLRYEVAIPLPESDEHGRDITAVAILVVFVFALLVGALSLVFGGDLESLTGATGLGAYLWVLPIGLTAAGTYQALSYWEVRRGAFQIIGKARVVQATSQAGGQIAIGALTTSGVGLGLGDAIGRSAGAFSYLLMIGRSDRRMLRAARWKNMRLQARRYKRFPFIGTWSALANAGAGHLTPLAVAVTFGPVPAGWFAVGLRVMALPVTILGQAVSQVYLHRAAEINRRSTTDLRVPFVSVTKRLLVIGALTVLPAGLVSPWLFPIVFGADWRNAGIYMLVATPMFYAQFVVSPLSQTLNVLNRQGTLLVWDVGRVVLILLAFTFGSVLAWSPAVTIGIFAGLLAAAYMALWVAMLWAIEQSEVTPRE
jgi:O-antigen/teichoic acid export membrane protein